MLGGCCTLRGPHWYVVPLYCMLRDYRVNSRPLTPEDLALRFFANSLYQDAFNYDSCELCLLWDGPEELIHKACFTWT